MKERESLIECVPDGAGEDYRVREWKNVARYHREHNHPIAGNLAADVADAIRYYNLHLSSPAFKGDE